MDIIRLILLQQEQEEKQAELDKFSEDQILYHIQLAYEAGLIEAALVGGDGRLPMAAKIHRLTWAGHDFLDAARDEHIWNQAKRRIVDKGGTMSFEVLKAVLIQVAKSAIGI